MIFEATITLRVSVDAQNRTEAKTKLKPVLQIVYPIDVNVIQGSLQVHKNSDTCPYDSHADDCTCEGVGGDR